MYCNPYKGIIPVSLRHFQSAFGLALDADLADGRYGTAGFRSAAEGLDPVFYRMGLMASLRSKVGVMITASHNPEKDNGVKLVEPMGEMLPQEWEVHATRLANAADSDLTNLLEELSTTLGVDLNKPGDVVIGRDTRASSSRLAMAVSDGVGVLRPSCVRSVGIVTTPQLHYVVRCENDPSYGTPSIAGYEELHGAAHGGEQGGCGEQEKLTDAFGKLLSSGARSPRKYKGYVNVDCACGVGSIALSSMVERLRQVGLTADLSCGRWVSFDGDADRVVYFFSQGGFCLLDGDRIALLLASFVKSLLTAAPVMWRGLGPAQLEKGVTAGCVGMTLR
eukprot:g13498.t1